MNETTPSLFAQEESEHPTSTRQSTYSQIAEAHNFVVLKLTFNKYKVTSHTLKDNILILKII